MLRKYCGASGLVLTLAASTAAFAQTAANSDTGVALEEIVVTARKTTENLQKAPASIDVVSSEEIQSAGISVPTDLEKMLPSAKLNIEGAVSQAFIRGVGSRLDFPNVSPGSAITYNGIILPKYGTKGMLFDLSSVQEIAGPQGTLYGGSAAGGAINLITQQPSNNYSGNALLEGGNFGEGHIAVNQNLALVPDQLSSRTSIDYNRHGGYESNDIDAANRIEGRESILFTPNEALTALVFLSGYRDTGTTDNGSSVNTRPFPSNPWYIPPVGSAGNPINSDILPANLQTYVAGANIDWRVGGGTITYIPGYVHVADYLHFFIDTGKPYGGLLDVHDKEDQVSQEIRWSQQFNALKLTAGLFWLQDKIDWHDGISLPVLPAALGYYFHVPIVDSFNQTNTNEAAFAQGVYSISDVLRATVGARISEDKISGSGIGNNGSEPYTVDKRQGTPDWKIGLDYDLAPQVLLYANFQTGYIPFGFIADSGNPAPILQQSRLLAYSGGIKSRFLDNTLEINDEFFYYDYNNFQAYSFNGALARTAAQNARKSRIYGDELTVRWSLSRNTKVDAAIVAENATYTEFSGRGYNYSGFQMSYAPKWNVILGLQHAIDLGSRGSLLGRVSTEYNSGYWGEYTHQGTFQPDYTKTDLTLTYAPAEGRWSVQAYVSNVENTATISAGSSGPNLGAGDLDPPRTYGLRITASWN